MSKKRVRQLSLRPHTRKKKIVTTVALLATLRETLTNHRMAMPHRPDYGLLDGDTLSEIPRQVHIRAVHDRDVIREHLERNVEQ